jgi:hypothetical protein
VRALYGEDEAVARFVQQLLGFERAFVNFKAIGFLDRDGALEAGVIYNNWAPESGVIEISAAASSHRWGTKERLRIIFEYPFSFCRMVIARTSENNPTPLRIWRALGANEYRIPDLRAPGEAEIITTLSIEQWKEWNHGRTVPRTAD